MASELSELRAELWRTRDDLERIKSRTSTSIDRSPSRDVDRRRHATGTGRVRDPRNAWHKTVRPHDSDVDGKGAKLNGASVRGGGVRSGVASDRPTSPPTSGESVGSERNGIATDGARGVDGDNVYSPIGAEAEATLCDLELEGVEFKNWTEEASTIAVRLIEEVKALRWERDTWRGNEAVAARAIEELRTRTEALETRLLEAEAEGKLAREALIRAQSAEKEQARAADRATADLRSAQEKMGALRSQAEMELGWLGGPGGVSGVGGAGGLRDQLRREKEGADALQRRLDEARAAVAGHDRERKEWRASRARLEELRRSWGKQLKKVELIIVVEIRREKCRFSSRVGRGCGSAGSHGQNADGRRPLELAGERGRVVLRMLSI